LIDKKNNNLSSGNVLPLRVVKSSNQNIQNQIIQAPVNTSPSVQSVNSLSPAPAPFQSFIPNQNTYEQNQTQQMNNQSIINSSSNSNPILPSRNLRNNENSDNKQSREHYDNVMSFSQLIFENKLNTIIDKMQKLEEENKKLKPLLKTIVDMQFYTFQKIKDYQKTIDQLISDKGRKNCTF
jgi:hypothetical protein